MFSAVGQWLVPGLRQPFTFCLSLSVSEKFRAPLLGLMGDDGTGVGIVARSEIRGQE